MFQVALFECHKASDSLFSHSNFFPSLSTHPLSHLCPFSLTSCLLPSFHPWLWFFFLQFMYYFPALSFPPCHSFLSIVCLFSPLLIALFIYSLTVCPLFLLVFSSFSLSVSFCPSSLINFLHRTPSHSALCFRLVSLSPSLSLPFWVLWLGCWHFHWDVYMTTEITLRSQSHLPSIYFSSSVSSFSTSAPQHFLLLLLSSPTFYFLAPFYTLPVLLSCFSANIPLFSLSVSFLSVSSSTLFTILHLSFGIFTPSFLYLSVASFSMPFHSHFPLSVSMAVSVDRLSKCQMATSATVGIIDSFPVCATQRDTGGDRVR